jgi:tetratricopeptide (TPR) repeat protein
MSWWSRLLGGRSESDLKPQRLDYLNEALALERQGDYDAALTSYRLALRDKPDDYRVLQNMAIAFSKTGRQDEAIRSYRRALEIEPSLSGAHYGLAFLLLKRGDAAGAAHHLEEFLARPPKGAEADRWVRHARETLERVRAGGADAFGDGTGEPTL